MEVGGTGREHMQTRKERKEKKEMKWGMNIIGSECVGPCLSCSSSIRRKKKRKNKRCWKREWKKWATTFGFLLADCLLGKFIPIWRRKQKKRKEKKRARTNERTNERTNYTGPLYFIYISQTDRQTQTRFYIMPVVVVGGCGAHL